MTPEEAIKIVKEKSQGRTRWEGQEPFLDEVLVEEIERLRDREYRMAKKALSVLGHLQCELEERGDGMTDDMEELAIIIGEGISGH